MTFNTNDAGTGAGTGGTGAYTPAVSVGSLTLGSGTLTINTAPGTGTVGQGSITLNGNVTSASGVVSMQGSVVLGGDVVIDTTNNRLVVQDGSTAGGFAAAKLSEVVTAGEVQTCVLSPLYPIAQKSFLAVAWSLHTASIVEEY